MGGNERARGVDGDIKTHTKTAEKTKQNGEKTGVSAFKFNALKIDKVARRHYFKRTTTF